MITRPRPQRRQLSQTPEEVAASLRHLPGIVWLDTSGRCPERDRDGAVSIMAACQERILRGHLSDPAPLDAALAELSGNSVDWGMPLEGLIGSVDYDGSYCFGLYTQVAVYRH